MNKIVLGAAVLSIAAGASAGTPDIIAYWAMNNNTLPGGGFGFAPSSFPQGADFGVQAGTANLTIGGGDILALAGSGNYQWVQSFAGSTINAQFGEPNGGSIAFQNGTGGINNGAYMDFNFNAALYENLEISFARQSTSTGFRDVTVDAYADGVLLGTIGAISNRDAFALYSFNTSLLDTVANATIRLTFTGGETEGNIAAGNNRVDNIVIAGTIIPTPGAVSLLGVAGLVAARRRR